MLGDGFSRSWSSCASGVARSTARLAKTAARRTAVIEACSLAAWRPWEVASSAGGDRPLAAQREASAAAFDEQ
jgi:hypothetical protein